MWRCALRPAANGLSTNMAMCRISAESAMRPPHENAMKSKRFEAILSVPAVLLLLSGCSLAPLYAKPDVALPGHFKEDRASGDAPAHAGSDYGAWQLARPAEGSERGEWWRIFH